MEEPNVNWHGIAFAAAFCFAAWNTAVLLGDRMAFGGKNDEPPG